MRDCRAEDLEARRGDSAGGRLKPTGPEPPGGTADGAGTAGGNRIYFRSAIIPSATLNIRIDQELLDRAKAKAPAIYQEPRALSQYVRDLIRRDLDQGRREEQP